MFFLVDFSRISFERCDECSENIDNKQKLNEENSMDENKVIENECIKHFGKRQILSIRSQLDQNISIVARQIILKEHRKF